LKFAVLKTESDMQRHPIDDIGLGVQRVSIAQHHRARVRGLPRLPNLKAAGETLQRKQSLGGEENSIARETLEKVHDRGDAGSCETDRHSRAVIFSAVCDAEFVNRGGVHAWQGLQLWHKHCLDSSDR
jgi:hypothetical protein